jgi:hypothetical protein
MNIFLNLLCYYVIKLLQYFVYIFNYGISGYLERIFYYVFVAIMKKLGMMIMMIIIGRVFIVEKYFIGLN